MNSNILMEGDVVSFEYNTNDGVTKPRLLYVEHVDSQCVGGYDYTAGGYRNFTTYKIKDPILLGTVKNKNDVKVEEETVQNLLGKYLGVTPVNDDLTGMHKYIQESFVDAWKDVNNNADCVLHKDGSAYIIKFNNQKQLGVAKDEVVNAFVNLLEVILKNKYV